MRIATFPCVLLVVSLSYAAAQDPLADDARATLAKATAFMRTISTEGGYLWKYSLDLKQRAGENKATDTQVWIQPPGTPSVGQAFLLAYEVTKDARYLDAAKAAADALARGQLESGGWDYLIDFDPKASQRFYLRSDAGKLSPKQISGRKNLTTFDDNNTQSALHFLLTAAEYSKDDSDERDKRIRDALQYGLTKMLQAQYPNGAWPQRWNGLPHKPEECPVTKARYPEDYPRTHPKQSYYAHYTLNDNAQRDCIQTMLAAWHRTGKAEYLAAAKRGGDFLILAQMPEPQPAWAQQYNMQMEPAWARAFEPPAITGNESVGAMQVLMELHLETGDPKYLQPLPAAIAWLKRSAVGPNTWARYYELTTNKQIFGDRDGKIYYRLEDISQERQSHYSWSGDYNVSRTIASYEKLARDGRDSVLKSREARAEGKSKRASLKSLAARTRPVIAAIDSQGRWVTKGRFGKSDGDAEDCIDTAVFIKNVRTLCDYLAAAGQSAPQ